MMKLQKLWKKEKKRAIEILTKYRKALDVIAQKLVEVETLEREEYELLLKTEGVEIKDVYRDARIAEERVGDPSKALESENIDKKVKGDEEINTEK